tara:strand:- start:150 stop:335 length:186 start_codon:yes stop_codon:yes gene_type:complete
MINTVEKIYTSLPVVEFSNVYKVTYLNNTIKFVPLDEANIDYQAIQEWAKIEGNNIIDPGA